LPALAAVPARSSARQFFDAAEHWYQLSANVLGRRTAELHAMLASSSDAAFAPEPNDRAALDQLANSMSEHADRTLRVIEMRLGVLNDATRGQAETLLASRALLRARFDAIRSLE